MNCFSCSPEPQSLIYPLFIAFPYPRPLTPCLPGDQKALPVLVSSVVQNLVVSVGRVRSVSKLVSPPRGLLAVTQQFFPVKEQQEEQTRSPRLCCWTEGLEDCHLSALLPPAPATLCPSVQERRVLLWPWGWAPSGRAVKETAGRMQGWAPRVGLLWNGSFWLALVLALVHADVVRPCISCKESLFVEKEI